MSQDEDITRIFFGKDNEPLTETLINELISSGWEEKNLRDYARQGFQYCRPRNSLTSPLLVEGNADFKKMFNSSGLNDGCGRTFSSTRKRHKPKR